MPSPPKADGHPPYLPGADAPQRASSVPKHLKSRLVKIWRGGEPKLRFMMSGDRSRWLPMRLWLHIALFFGLGVAAMFALWAIFERVFSPSLDDPLKVEVFRLILYIIAGIGGVFALVIAYRRQGLNETAEVRTERAEAREDGKVFNERFKSAAEQLSSEHAANRLAGVYAMAGLADDWDPGRQTCINVLCAYLRMPYDSPTNAVPPETADDDTAARIRKDQKERRQEQQVRHTIVTVIGERLRTEPIEGKTWHGQNFDFTEAHLDGGDLSKINVTGGVMRFRDAVFSGEQVNFSYAKFYRGVVDFSDTVFHSRKINFASAKFSGAHVEFSDAVFSGERVDFTYAKFSRGVAEFSDTVFSGEQVDFTHAKFSGAHVEFNDTVFSCEKVDFSDAEITGGQVRFSDSVFNQGDFRFPASWGSPPMFADDDPQQES